MEKYLLTTIDNPFNPFTQYDEWYAWDERDARKMDRPTCIGYFDRLAALSDEISDKEFTQVSNDIVDEIVALNLSGKFARINKKGEKSVVPAN